MFYGFKSIEKRVQTSVVHSAKCCPIIPACGYDFSDDNQNNKEVDLQQLLGNCASHYVKKLPYLPLKTVVYGIASAKKQIAVVKLLCSSQRRMPCIVDIANTLAQEALVNGKDNILNRNINLLAASLGERFQIEAADIF